MRTHVNKDEARREWIIEAWYEKATFILGAFLMWFWAMAFVVGVIEALFE